MNPIILECKGLSKRYANALYAVDNLNLSLERGQIVGLLGPNGSGKSTLIEQTYLSPSMKVTDAITYFTDFYHDFRPDRALKMLKDLDIDTNARLKTLSKGAKEKVQLILVMSRDAMLYILDEPIGGVDSAAREYILRTILMNYNENATILLSTHLIQDIENVLDRVIFLQNGRTVLNATVDEIRMEQRKSVDVLFREVYRC